jgi:tetratricopeptide (TPR) repeat protein
LQLAEPTSIAVRSLLAETCFRSGDYGGCRELIVAMQADGVETSLGRVALALLDFMDGNVDGVFRNLQRAEATGQAPAGVLELAGRLYLRLRRLTEGAYYLEKALSLDPMRASAHDGRAIAHLLAGDPANAEREAREAVRLNARARGAQYHLGVALERQNRVEDAIAAYKSAAALDPHSAASAHRRLAALFERRGERAFAVHHRALAQRGAGESLPSFDVEWFHQGLASDAAPNVS